MEGCVTQSVSQSVSLSHKRVERFTDRSIQPVFTKLGTKRCDHMLLLAEIRNIHVRQTGSGINFYNCPYRKIALMLNISKTVRYTMLNSKAWA